MDDARAAGGAERTPRGDAREWLLAQLEDGAWRECALSGALLTLPAKGQSPAELEARVERGDRAAASQIAQQIRSGSAPPNKDSRAVPWIHRPTELSRAQGQ